MKTKEQIEQEFQQTRGRMEEAQNVVKQCEVQLNRLQGQFQLLDEMEKEANMAKVVADKIIKEPKESK